MDTKQVEDVLREVQSLLQGYFDRKHEFRVEQGKIALYVQNPYIELLWFKVGDPGYFEKNENGDFVIRYNPYNN